MKTLLQYLQDRIKSDQNTISKFQKEIEPDPAYALTWSNNVFKAAASLRVHKFILRVVEQSSQSENEKIESYVNKMMVQMAQSPAQSTSPTSNLIHQYELAAYAELSEELKYFIKNQE